VRRRAAPPRNVSSIGTTLWIRLFKTDPERRPMVMLDEPATEIASDDGFVMGTCTVGPQRLTITVGRDGDGALTAKLAYADADADADAGTEADG
jgi:hypothetical protein